MYYSKNNWSRKQADILKYLWESWDREKEREREEALVSQVGENPGLSQAKNLAIGQSRIS